MFIANDDRLRYLITYVHHNPIHHGFSKGYDSWKYSSFNVFKTDKGSKVARNQVLDLFGGPDNFFNYHSQFKVEKASDTLE